MKIKIKVTKEILNQSKNCVSAPCMNPGDFERRVGTGFNCAISLAVNDLFDMAWVSHESISIGQKYEDIFETTHSLSINLPSEARLFIRKFDMLYPEERGGMQPIEFEIYVPDDVIESIGLSEVHRILKESKTLELV